MTKNTEEGKVYLKTKFTCIRHPKITISRDYCYGQSDIPPNEEHLNEIYQEVKKNLKSYSTIFSSPLKRCAKLAKKLSPHTTYDDRLKEISFGDWEMKKWSEIGESSLNVWLKALTQFTPPKGESFLSFKKRILNFLKERSKKLENSLIITHSGVIRALLILLGQKKFSEVIRMKIIYGQTVSFNFDGYLDEESAFLKMT